MMPGAISFGRDERWRATDWLFCWVVGFLAKNVEQQRLAADIDHAGVDGSCLLAFEMFGPEADREMRALLRDRLVPVAEGRFPPEMHGRAMAMRSLRELAVLAARSPVDGRSFGEPGRTAGVPKATYRVRQTTSAAL
jgi:hypothetical protein